MKELSIEVKAKRYDEAIERAKSLIDFCSDSELKTLEYVFPELKESEDEKIRKEIIELVMQPTWKTEKEFNRRNELCEWLEKQGKTSPVFSNSSNIGKDEHKPAWSEENKEIIDYLIDYLESELDSSYTDLDKETFTKEINWLKSLRPHQQWKPSDEKMEYLAKAITTLGDEGNCKTASILNDLRVELKKLKGE